MGDVIEGPPSFHQAVDADMTSKLSSGADLREFFVGDVWGKCHLCIRNAHAENHLTVET